MRRRSRVLLWTAGVLGALAVGAFIAVQAALRSDLPRRRVVEALEATTGLVVRIGGLQTGWGGETALTDVSLTGALEDKPLATLPSVKIDHTALLRMIATRTVKIDRVRIEGGDVYLREGGSGQWNVMPVIDRLAHATTGPKSAHPPAVEIRGLHVHATTAEGRTLDAQPLTVHGERVGEVAWRFEGSLSSIASVEGRVSLGGELGHDLKITVADASPVAQMVWGDAPHPLSAQLAWQGHRTEGGLRGYARIARMQVGDYRASGPAEISIGSGSLMVEPRGLEVRTPWAMGDVRVSGGRATLSRESFSFDGLTADLMDATARIDGQYRFAQRSGEGKVAWSGRVEEPRVDHQAQVAVKLAQPTPGRLEITAHALTTGQTAAGRWDAALNAQADGERLDSLRWHVEAPKMDWVGSDSKEWKLAGLSAEMGWSEGTATLENLRLPGDQKLEASGRIDLQKRAWTLTVASDRFVPPGRPENPLKLSLQASGEGRRVEFKKLDVEADRFNLSGVGSYDPSRAIPLESKVTVGYELSIPNNAPPAPPPPSPPAPATALPPPAPPAPPPAPPAPPLPRWAGRVSWEGTINGSIEPRKLLAQGDLTAQKLVLNRHALHPLKVPLIVQAEHDTVEARSEGFELLAGRSTLNGRYGLTDRGVEAHVKFDRIALGGAAPFVNPKLAVKGQLNAEFALHMAGWDVEKILADGSWSVDKFESANFAFDHMEGRLDTHGGLLRLDPITLAKGEGRAKGVVTFDLSDGRTLTAELDLKRWPHRLESQEVDLAVDGDLSLRSDVIEHTVHGHVGLGSDIAFRGHPGGRVDISGELTEQAVTVRRLKGKVLNGTVDGQASILIKDLSKSTGHLTWIGLEPAAARTWWEYPEQVSGTVSGELSFGPATGPRPLEPVQYRATFTPQELTIRGLPFQAMTLSGFVGRDRFIIDKSEAPFADGKVNIWAAATRRQGRWSTHAELDFKGLDLDYLHHFVNPQREGAVPGRLDGEVLLLGPLGDELWPNGKARVHITDSDLVNANILGVVFRVMGMSRRTDPHGEGSMRLSLENKALRVYDYRYFNRGVEAIGDGYVEDLSKGKDSPISVFLIGAQRPFRGWRLPLFKDLDRIIASLQSNLTTVRMRGTLRDPEPELVPIAAISKAFKSLLFNPRKQERRQTDEQVVGSPRK